MGEKIIIDAHVHLGKSFGWASYESYIFETPDGPSEYFTPEIFLKIMDSLKIDKAIIMTTKQAAGYETDDVKENEEIAAAARKYPDRFIGFAIINPLKGEKAVEELTRYVKELGIKGLKLHPFAQCYAPYLPFVHPLVERAIKLKIPVMVHSGTPPHSEPFQIAMLADTFPEATIIMAHMGLSETYAADARYAAKKYDNIFLETSCLPAGYVKKAIMDIGAERVIYGSDTPWNITELELMKIKALRLPENKERLVLGENIAEILGLRD